MAIQLSEEQRHLAEFHHPGPLIIKGIAGSGKSTIALKRISYLLEKDKAQKEKILLVTYQGTLRDYLKYLLEKDRSTGQTQILWETDDRVDVRTIDQLIYQEYLNFRKENRQHYPTLPKDVGNERYWKYDILDKALKEVTENYPDVPLLFRKEEHSFLIDEIKYINANNLNTVMEYQIFDRKGRGRKEGEKRHFLPKKSRVREAIFRLREAYNRQMVWNGKIDFEAMRLLALKQVRQKPPKQYTHLIIDESQDLDKTRIDFLKHFLTDEPAATATFLYDTTQSIYPNSWLGNNRPFNRLGIDAQGRTFVLKKNYRTTREVQEAAFSMLRADPRFARDTEAELINKVGLRPEWAHLQNYQQQAEYVINRIRTLQDHIGLHDIIIASRRKADLDNFALELEKANIPYEIITARNNTFGHNRVRLMTLHATKGIESEAVFLINLNDGVIPVSSREELLPQERKLLYVGMTRASRYLFLSSYGNTPSPFLENIDPDKLDRIDPDNIGEYDPHPVSEETKEKIRKWEDDLNSITNELDGLSLRAQKSETSFRSMTERILDLFHRSSMIKEECLAVRDELSTGSYVWQHLHKLCERAEEAHDQTNRKFLELHQTKDDLKKMAQELKERFDRFSRISIDALNTVTFSLRTDDPQIIEMFDWGHLMAHLSKVLEKEMRDVLALSGEDTSQKSFQELISTFRDFGGEYTRLADKLERIGFRRLRNKAIHREKIPHKKVLEMYERLMAPNGIFDKLNELL